MVEGRERALKTTLKVKIVEDVVYMILFRFPFDFGVDFRCLGGSRGCLGRVLGVSWEGLGEVLGGLGAILGRHEEQFDFKIDVDIGSRWS